MCTHRGKTPWRPREKVAHETNPADILISGFWPWDLWTLPRHLRLDNSCLVARVRVASLTLSPKDPTHNELSASVFWMEGSDRSGQIPRYPTRTQMALPQAHKAPQDKTWEGVSEYGVKTNLTSGEMGGRAWPQGREVRKLMGNWEGCMQGLLGPCLAGRQAVVACGVGMWRLDRQVPAVTRGEAETEHRMTP
ncbi:hypothetical protein Cadr_000003398 [Camelus dromedarius]|uniref:Uncharacterized protein n=1 Tax=Camelus dromedarius TaxID=9838 RepID=A0A5N4C260_CAMDR|nr:hypothetical protein Cadr_000003398 [Camelus dromedarius]